MHRLTGLARGGCKVGAVDWGGLPRAKLWVGEFLEGGRVDTFDIISLVPGRQEIAFALGYIGAWATITIGLVYLAIHAFEAISFTFFFFSGVVATRREQLAMRRAKVNRPLPVGLVPMKPKAR